MNNTANPISRIQEIITKGTHGAIVLPSNPTPDAVASAAALYLGLLKLGKNIAFVCDSVPQIDVIGVDKIQQQLITSGDNLVVSFPYKDGSIDKVDYNIQGERFNLIISPRAGAAKLNPTQVTYAYTGGMLNFIITVDAPSLNSLGSVYTDNQSQFQGKDIINIDRHLTNGFYGTANLVNKTASSISEMILGLLSGIQAEIDKDMATNLYLGISAATNNFTSYSVNATTFDTVAQLLRMGAVKKTYKKPVAPAPSSPQPFVANQSMSFPVATPASEWTENVKPIEQVEKQTNPEGPPAPQDWLKPKIFRGGNTI